MRQPVSTLLFIGAGGFGQEIYSYVTRHPSANQAAIRWLDDIRTQSVLGVPVLGPCTDRVLRTCGPCGYLITIGDNGTRRYLATAIESWKLPGAEAWTLIDSDAQVGTGCALGHGSIVCPGVILTVGVQIGQFCIVNIQSFVAHNSRVGDFVNIGPGANICGEVTLHDGIYVGAGATVMPGVTIGAWSVVGAGAVVTTDMPSHVVVAGVPAKVIREQGSA